MGAFVWNRPGSWVALSATLALTAVPLMTAGAAQAQALPVTAPVSSQPVKASDAVPARVTAPTWGDLIADLKAWDGQGYQASKDPGSLYTITKAIGARQVWDTEDAEGRAVTGKGVTVAVLDSGVAEVPGLNATGKVVRGPDLSLEANSTTKLSEDSFGHGTHMAGIIAGRDPVLVEKRTGKPVPLLARQQLGIAPDAKLLALKLATTDGSTDVSQVIAALDWVSQHRDDQGMNVRVVNLSFGTGSVQPYQIDPLAAAAENAWHKGIVVVVSGGNAGSQASGLTDPAIDPYVIAVGSSDAGRSTSGWDQPTVASFSSVGTTARSVDLVAPGSSIVSFRAPGSFVDRNSPTGRVSGDASERLFRGSGTSQAAAVVSGAAALLLQAYPDLTPDQVKAALVRTATPLVDATRRSGGAGQVDVAAAAAAVKRAYASTNRAATLLGARQTFPRAAGTGSLEGARGGAHLMDLDGKRVLLGETDVQGRAWRGGDWAAASAAGTTWSGGTWNGARWSGDDWSGARWSGARWSGARWSGARWSATDWDAARWSAARWSDAAWERARWSASGWS